LKVSGTDVKCSFTPGLWLMRRVRADFCHHALGLRELELPDYPRTQGLYSHFTGVSRLEGTSWSRIDEPPPYPIDDAAVHHVFDGGWIWVLQFNNGCDQCRRCGNR
jgi:hypothetical protein